MAVALWVLGTLQRPLFEQAVSHRSLAPALKFQCSGVRHLSFDPRAATHLFSDHGPLDLGCFVAKEDYNPSLTGFVGFYSCAF